MKETMKNRKESPGMKEAVKHREGIIEHEKGIPEKDGIYFHDAGEFGLKHLFYPKWGAEYLCVYPYEVQREYLDAFMCFFVTEGTLYFEYRGERFGAREGQFVLLDCHFPNHYWAEEPVRYYWMHFGGNVSAEYTEYLYQQQGACFNETVSRQSGRQLKHLLSELKRGDCDEHYLSYVLHSMLSNLSSTSRTVHHPIVTEALSYIREHVTEDLRVEELADAVHVSPVHLTRLFRKELDISPHDYVIQQRLSQARNLLLSTDMSVERVAEECGFAGSTHFIRSFKQRMGMTPLRFRKEFWGI